MNELMQTHLTKKMNWRVNFNLNLDNLVLPQFPDPIAQKFRKTSGLQAVYTTCTTEHFTP